ncbi:type II toxin-antitoxin system prevent-host-death family antitoxin [Streptomyces sp. NPDC058632]|uniref:type II toxin-antitoxin system prevent-host-death family antitoxin n=1 Tax=unclassified Streptomyces TaxID=2593676 RepID=UPI00364A7822
MNEEPAELSVAAARRQFADILNSASARSRITYITNRGRRVAAVVPLHVAEDAERSPSSARLPGEEGPASP